jgi:hypothetical protein
MALTEPRPQITMNYFPHPSPLRSVLSAGKPPAVRPPLTRDVLWNRPLFKAPALKAPKLSFDDLPFLGSRPPLPTRQAERSQA